MEKIKQSFSANKQSFSANKLFFKKNQPFVFVIGILGVIINVAFFQSINSPVLITLVIYWIIIGAIYKITEKFLFILALICLVLTAPLFLLNNAVMAERFSVWEFLFIVLGLWQFFYLELREKFFRKK